MDNELQKKIVDKYARLVSGQREEIMTAFLAKYGFEPGEEVVQFHYGNRWGVARMDAQEYQAVKAEVIKSTAAKEIVTLIRDIVLGMTYAHGDQYSDAMWNYSPIDEEGRLKKLAELLGMTFDASVQRYVSAEPTRIISGEAK